MGHPPDPLARVLSGAAGELGALLERVAGEVADRLERTAAGCADALRGGGRILLAGNGGSAAQCQHLATELVVRFRMDRPAYAALALAADPALLTAVANDLGFEEVFARQIEALGRPGDVLLALSTSGRSANVLRAADAARDRGLAVYGWTGEGGAELAGRCDEAIVVPHGDPARVQEVHLFLGHLLCGEIEARLAAG